MDPRLLAQLVAVSADALYSADLKGAITSWNAAAVRLYGIPASDMLGRPATDLLPAGLNPHLHSVYRRGLAGERVEHFDAWHRRADGAAIAVSVSLSPLVGADGEVIGVASCVRAAADRSDAGTAGDAKRERAFSKDMTRELEQRAVTASELRLALDRDELVVHYQPVVDLETGTASAVEALVRWEHPSRGLVAPGEFIPVAEATGLIVELGRWVLQRACRDAVDLTDVVAGLQVAVNVSARELAEPDIAEHVRHALAASGLEPHRLVLEVTESAVMEDEAAASKALEELAGLGVGIAVDDFGTGYGSLVYLRRFPIGVLKLDRAFVAGIGSPRDEAICRTVVGLARAVSATCIAEGVETAEQYAALHSYGCEQAQGFLWSPAVPIEELAAVLASCGQVPRPLRTSPQERRASPPTLAPHVAEQIVTMHRSGASLHTIAAVLNAGDAPCPSGRRWSASGVSRHFAASRRTPGAGSGEAKRPKRLVPSGVRAS